MTRLIMVLVLLVALLSLATFEQIYIGKTYDHMIEETAALIAYVDATPEGPEKKTVFGNDIIDRMDDLYKFWIKKEHRMCSITRHLDLSYISDALIYARNFIDSGNKEEASGGLERLKYFVDSYSKIYKISFSNIL